MFKIISPYDYNYEESQKRDHVDWPVSQTVEDDSLSVKDILANYTRGMDVGVNPYSDSDDGITDDIDDFGSDTVNAMLDFNSLDLTEIDDIRRGLNQRASQIRKASRTADAPTQVSDVPSPEQGDSESQ